MPARRRLRAPSTNARALALALALVLLAPASLAGCLERFGIGGDEEPSEEAPKGPIARVEVLNANGLGLKNALVCVGDTEEKATQASPGCFSTGDDGIANVEWPCAAECATDRYVGAVCADTRSGVIHKTQEPQASKAPRDMRMFIPIAQESCGR